MIPRVGGRPSTNSSLTTACFLSPGACTVAATRSIASLARSRQRTRTFGISRLPRPRNWAMADGSVGSRVVLVRRQRTPGLISSLPGTAGLPPFISFSTSYPENSLGRLKERSHVSREIVEIRWAIGVQRCTDAYDRTRRDPGEDQEHGRQSCGSCQGLRNGERDIPDRPAVDT